MTLEEMKVIIRAETKQYRDELAKMQTQTKAATADVERQTSKIKGAFAGIGKVVASLGIGYGLYRLGKQALGYASDLQEVQNVVDTAFGDMNYKCEAFAKNSIKQFGMSELSAKKTASTYMAMAKGIGMGSGSASNMAIDLAGFTGDVASFFNISQEEAGTKLKSIFTGETETLKDLGVVMTQTNLKQYALNNGLSDNIESMDQASLATLRYKFVTDQLALAQGDFSKTSGSWANQVRILQEQWKSLMGIVGNGLVAVFTPIIRAINTAISKIIQFAQVVQAVFSSLFGKKGKSPGDEAKKIGSNLGGAESNASGLNDQLDKTASKAKKAAGQLASIDEINNMSSSSSGGDGAGSASIGGVDTGMDFGLDEEADTSGIDKTISKVKAKLESLKKTIEKYKVPIISAMAGVVAGVGTFAVLKNITGITAAMGVALGPLKTLAIGFSVFFAGISEGSGVFTSLCAVLGTTTTIALAIAAVVAAVTAALVYLYQTSDSFRSLVNEAVSSLFGILKNFYDSILVPLFSFLMDVFNTVLVPIASFIAKVFVKAIELFASVVLSLWNNILAPLVNFLVDILGIALQGVIEIWEAWKPVIEMLFAAINWIWDTALSPIVDWIKNTFIKIFEQWGTVIKELIPNVKQIFQGLVDFLVGIFTLDIDKCWQGITEIFKGFDNFLSNIFKTDWTSCFGYLGNIINGFLVTVSGIWESIKQIFNGVITFVRGVFSGDWRMVWQGVIDIFSGIFSALGTIVKAPMNAVIAVVNGAIDAINSISVKIPKWVPGVGGQKFGLNLGKVRYLARGAVVDKPTPAIFGEAGAEAVIPLENNTGWMAKIASGISDYMGIRGSEDINDLIILMQELIEVVREKNVSLSVALDERKLNKSNQREEQLGKLRTGTV